MSVVLDAVLIGSDKVEVLGKTRTFRSPIYDCARALLADGVPPETLIVFRRGETEVLSRPWEIGRLAKFTVVERDRDGLALETFRPHPRSRPQKAISSPAGTTQDGDLDPPR